jgi:hypothetical protein
MPDLQTFSALASALTLGAMAFFSFAVAPLVFARLPRETAGQLMRAAFPVYYVVLAATSAVAALLAGLGSAGIALWIVTAAFLLMRFWLVPALDRARGKNEPAFKRLHGLSMIVNLAQMALLLFAALRLAA